MRRATDHIGRGTFDPAVQERVNAEAITALRSAQNHLEDVAYVSGLEGGSPLSRLAAELIAHAEIDLVAALRVLGSA